MGIISWVVVGAVAGWLAGMVMKGRGFGCFGNVVIGIVGALIGGWLAVVVFNIPRAISGINPTTIVVAFLGAVLVLYIARLAKI